MFEIEGIIVSSFVRLSKVLFTESLMTIGAAPEL